MIEAGSLELQIDAERWRFIPDAVALFLPWLASLEALPPAAGR